HQHADEAPEQVVRLERNAISIPKVGQRGIDPQKPHFSIGMETLRRYENISIPKIVTLADRMAAPFSVVSRSPSAETKTQANVAGSRPRYLPNATNRTGPAMMQNQPRHSACGNAPCSSLPPA